MRAEPSGTSTRYEFPIYDLPNVTISTRYEYYVPPGTRTVILQYPN